MKYVGIDVGSEKHAFAIVDDQGSAVGKPRFFDEDAAGYEKLREVLPAPEEVLVGLEATGHYWRNLYLTLLGWGYRIAVLNPRSTSAFAGEELRRAKTDPADAQAIARYLQQKRPEPKKLPCEAQEELKELSRARARLQVDLGAVNNSLHRMLDLTFPEFTDHVKNPVSQTALKLLSLYPTAERFAKKDIEAVARVQYDERHQVGEILAAKLIETAKRSVAQHHGTVYEVQTRQLVRQAQLLLEQIGEMDRLIDERMDDNDIGKLLRSIPGIGEVSAQTLVGELGDLSQFASAKQVVAFIGASPGIRHSGKSKPGHAPMCKVGTARVRKILWMATLTATQRNPVIRAFYERLIGRGKPKMAALGACLAKLVHLIFAVVRDRRPFYVPTPA